MAQPLSGRISRNSSERASVGVPIGTLALDSELIVVGVNPSARRILGSAADPLGSSVLEVLRDLCAPAVAEELAGAIRDAASSQTAFAREIESGAGGRCLSLTVAPLATAPGAAAGSVLLIEDISDCRRGSGDLERHLADAERSRRALLSLYEDQARSHAALRETATRLRLAIDAAKLHPWDWDIALDRLHWGRDPADLLGPLPPHLDAYPDFRELVHPEDRERYLAAGRKSLAGEAPYELEFRIRTLDGRTRWIYARGVVERDAAGAPQRMRGVSQDVSDRVHLTQSLRESEEILRLFIHYAPSAIAMFDRDMRYLAYSRRWLSDYRLGERDLRGLSHYDVLPDLPESRKEVHRRCLAGAVERHEEVPFPRADGSIDWVCSEVHPWRDATGAIGGIISFSEVVTARKQAQDALRESEEKFVAAFRHSPAAMVISTPEGVTVEANPAFCDLVGYSRADITGKRVTDLGILSPAQRAHLAAGTALEGERPHEQLFLVRRRDGGTRQVLISAAQFHLRGVPHRLTIGTDITERARAEESLRESEARMRLVTDNVPAMIGYYDRELVIRFANRAFLEFHFGGSESALGQPLRAAFGESVWESVESHFRRALAGEVVRYERPARRALDGAARAIEVNLVPDRDERGIVRGVYGLGLDITEPRERELALRDSEDRYRQLFDRNPLPLCVYDQATLRIVEVNQAAIDAYGYARQEFLGMSIVDLQAPEERAAVERELRALHRRPEGAGEAARVVERRHVTKDGRTIDAQITAQTISGMNLDSHHPTARLISINDVTARRLAEKAMLAATERRRTLAARLLLVQEEERTAIARELHDDIGQSLTALKLQLNQVAREANDANRAGQLESALGVTNALLAQVRNLSLGLRPPQLELMGLEAALAWHLRNLSAHARIELSFTARLQPGGRSPQIDIACFRIVQEAFTNILRYAGATAVTVVVEQTADELGIEIRDDGKGFDLGRAKRNALAGSSMGLLSMEERASLLGGTLRIDSAPGAGTAIHVRIPLVRRKATGATPRGGRA